MAQDSFDAISLATNLLNDLSDSQKEVISFPLDDPAKTRWHYLPHDSFAREGLPFSDMTPAQIEKTYALLEAYLSKSGYDQMQQIIDLENYLAVAENNPYKRDASKYYIAIYGTPHKDSLWACLLKVTTSLLTLPSPPSPLPLPPPSGAPIQGLYPRDPKKEKSY